MGKMAYFNLDLGKQMGSQCFGIRMDKEVHELK